MMNVDTVNRRRVWDGINTTRRLVHVDSDILFLSHCRQHNLIPKGLQIKNPLQHTHNSDFARKLCARTSQRLMNHRTHQLYCKRNSLQVQKTRLLASLPDDQLRRDIGNECIAIRGKEFQSLLQVKKKKTRRVTESIVSSCNFHLHQFE